MRLDQFDLNLLIAFDTLLKEQNVTRAAAQLHMTQSAMSAALKRLRESLHDEILVQHGKKMIPTPRALALAPQISAAILGLRNILASAVTFDPAQSSRCFRIAASDYVTTVLITPLLERLHEEAPSIEFELRLPDMGCKKALDDGELDLLLTPTRFLAPEHPSELLLSERFVVLGCASNPVLQTPMTLDDYWASDHIAVCIQGIATFAEEIINSKGDQRHIAVVAPSFLQVPWMLRNTNRLAVVHERLARLLVEPFSLRYADCPLELPAMQEMMQYHTARKGDQGLCWLRDLLKAAAAGQIQANSSRPDA